MCVKLGHSVSSHRWEHWRLGLLGAADGSTTRPGKGFSPECAPNCTILHNAIAGIAASSCADDAFWGTELGVNAPKMHGNVTGRQRGEQRRAWAAVCEWRSVIGARVARMYGAIKGSSMWSSTKGTKDTKGDGEWRHRLWVPAFAGMTKGVGITKGEGEGTARKGRRHRAGL